VSVKARLLALAALVAAAGAGTLVLVDWDTAQPVKAPPGAFEILDRTSCTVAACGAQLCAQADNVLVDAGSACSTRLVTCDVRVGQQARDWAADAGLTLGAKRYQRLRFVGLRCPGADGGSSFGVPMDSTGMPQFASVTTQAPRCARAPLDGGLDCLRTGAAVDGGARFFGTGNVFLAGEASGTQCEAVQCGVVFGDDADLDL
jgi:hypothetical protein